MGIGFSEVILGLLLLTAIVIVLRVLRHDPDREVVEWAAAYGLRVTPGNREFIGAYRRMGRRLRFVCSIAGLVLIPVASYAAGRETDGSVSIFGLIAGYMVGTLWAELSLTRPREGRTRTAALLPRRLPDYLPGRLRWGLRIIGLTTTVLAIATLVVEPADEAAITTTTRVSVALALSGVSIAVVVEAAQRWILRRPQPFVAPDLVAADDAVRASSLHALAGSGIATLLLLMVAPAAVLASSDVQLLRWAMPWLALSSLLGAMVAIRYYVYRGWRVRRPVPPLAVGG